MARPRKSRATSSRKPCAKGKIRSPKTHNCVTCRAFSEKELKQFNRILGQKATGTRQEMCNRVKSVVNPSNFDKVYSHLKTRQDRSRKSYERAMKRISMGEKPFGGARPKKMTFMDYVEQARRGSGAAPSSPVQVPVVGKKKWVRVDRAGRLCEDSLTPEQSTSRGCEYRKSGSIFTPSAPIASPVYGPYAPFLADDYLDDDYEDDDYFDHDEDYDLDYDLEDLEDVEDDYDYDRDYYFRPQRGPRDWRTMARTGYFSNDYSSESRPATYEEIVAEILEPAPLAPPRPAAPPRIGASMAFSPSNSFSMPYEPPMKEESGGMFDWL